MSIPHPMMAAGLRRRSLKVAAAVLGVTLLGVYSVDSAGASGTVTVACGAVAGSHGLIAEVNAANTPSGPRVITLAKNCTYTLTEARPSLSSSADHDGLPPVTGRLTILGQGSQIQRSITGSGIPAFRVFEVGPRGRLTLNSVVIRGGLNPQGGGGYNARGGVLSLVNAKLVQNTATGGDGGGLLNDGTASITDNSAVSANNALGSASQSGAFGGGIENNGTLMMSNGTVSFDRATALSSSRGQAEGAGISNFGTMTLTTMAIASNAAESDVAGGFAAGGGIQSNPFGTPASTTLTRPRSTATPPPIPRVAPSGAEGS